MCSNRSSKKITTLHHNFGTRRVLLTIAAAHKPNITLTGWISPRPPGVPHNVMRPPGMPCLPSTQPSRTQYDRIATSPRDEGIGRPSKYLDLPAASLGINATVALKRARRARPQHMKPVKHTVSRYVRRPTAKATTAGATPNDTYRTIKLSE
jgi:hypothetical protein